MNSTLAQQTTDQYNLSVSSGFTEILLFSDVVSYNGSTTYNGYNDTSIVVLFSTTSSSFVSRSNGRHGGSRSSELITGVTVSCITCVIILLIIIALIIWRHRAVPQQSTSSAVDRLEAHKHGAVSAHVLYTLEAFSGKILIFTQKAHMKILKGLHYVYVCFFVWRLKFCHSMCFRVPTGPKSPEIGHWS